MTSPWKIAPGHFGTGPENIHIVKNFIDLDDAKRIEQFARTIKQWKNPSPDNIYSEDGTCTYDASYWNDRQCPWDILQSIDLGIYELIDSYIAKLNSLASELFNVSLSNRPPCIIRWFPGIEQKPHADKQMNNGLPNPFPDYDINSLFYYNDDFDGGELYYPQHGITVKPEPGLAVVHPGDINYLHGVNIVTSGERFTTPAFYSVIQND